MFLFSFCKVYRQLQMQAKNTALSGANVYNLGSRAVTLSGCMGHMEMANQGGICAGGGGGGRGEAYFFVCVFLTICHGPDIQSQDGMLKYRVYICMSVNVKPSQKFWIRPFLSRCGKFFCQTCL